VSGLWVTRCPPKAKRTTVTGRLIGAAQGEHETKEAGRLGETARRLLNQLVSGRGVQVEAACGWN